MREFNIGLVHHGITHGGIYLDVPQELLHLLHRHPFVNGHSGQCPAELVGMDARHLQAAAQLAKADLNAGDLEPLVRFVQCHEQGRILILAAFEILLQVNLRPGIEIDHALLVSFAKNDALALGEIDICAVELDQFTDTHPG